MVERKLKRICCLLLIAGLPLAGCVSTQTGGFTEKASQKKALEYSVQLARQYLAAGNWEAAQRHLKTALEIDGNNADVHAALAMVFQNTGELERAEQEFERALELESDNSRIRNNYAVFLYGRGRYRDAEQQLQKVVADVLYDKRADAFVNLGIVRQELGDWRGSQQALERALLMEPKSRRAALKLARSYYELGDYGQAQKMYDRFRRDDEVQSAEALWLGIRLADRFEDKNAFASYALALKNLYPKSEEYLAFKGQYGDVGTR